MRPKILVIVGPTASGKSEFAVKFAKKFNGEIVSADSRQVYKGLNIGSGKVPLTPSTKHLVPTYKGIPHHMLDVASPKRVYTVSHYKADAEGVIDDILKRGKLPILVGGTGHYIDAVTKGQIVPEVPPNTKLRSRLEEILKGKDGTSKLFKMLVKLDKSRAKQIDQHNPRRLVRAIEIAMALGKVPKLKAKPHYSPIVIGIKIPIHDLRFKIHERLLARMRQGMVSEVKKLRSAGLSWKRLCDLGLEYRYVSLYLQDKLTKQAMLTRLESEINHYAKRQMTWFKRDKNIIWVNVREQANLSRLAMFAKQISEGA